MTPPPVHPQPRTRPFISRPVRRLWAAGLAGTLLPLLLCCLLGYFALARSRDQYEQRAELLSQNLAGALERSVSAEIEKIDLTLGSIVAELESQLADGGVDMRQATRQIEAQTRRRRELEGVRVTDRQGIAILGVGIAGQAPIDFSDREWFRIQRDQPGAGLYMSRPLVSKVTGGLILSFSRRYRSPDGQFAGAVSAAVPLSYLANTLSTVDVGPHGAVSLRHADLSLISRQGATGVAGAAAIGSRSAAPELRALIESGRTQGSFHSTATIDAIERRVTVRRLAIAPLLVTVGVATQDYMSDWQAELRTVTAFGIGAVLACTLGTVLLLRALVQNRASRERIQLLAHAFEHCGEAIAVVDRGNRIVEVNPAFERQSGYTSAEVVGRDPTMVLAGREGQQAQSDAIRTALRSEGRWRGEMWDRHKDGHEFPTWVTISAVRDATGRISHMITNSTDLTELKQAEARILHLAHHDTLTRLPNRVQLQTRLEQAMATARREGSELAMLFIDMDHFKTINDTLGHQVGDALLVEVGERLRGVVRGSDIVARLGGDEFVLVLTGVGRQAAQAATLVATKVVALLGQPYPVAGHELHSTPSIGIGIFPGDGEDADTLMKSADTAMYHAKSAGRNNHQFFTSQMKQASAERLVLESGLRHAIARDELLLHYQPQLDLASGRIVGLEALLRWRHPTIGLIPPLKFIPVAEETGQIEAIGNWVLDRALAQIAGWRDTLDSGLRVAVNLSAQQLRGEGFAAQVAAALRRHRLPGAALELEITESTAMRDPARTAALLRELRAHGVALAIDDFGTGHSSLAYLKQLPLSCLKLDRSFVTDIERDSNDAAISQATILLAHNLGLAVVAEGVETAAQLDFLRRLNCDMVQGYLISRPLDAAASERFLRHAIEHEREDAAAAVA